VLNNLSERIAYCYRRAGECRELAEISTSPSDKVLYLERERGWLLLARSYQLSDSAGSFVNELRSRLQFRGIATPTCPGCAVPTRQVCWSTIFVCTNCRRVVEDK
jgi:hypothetical protein